VNTEKKIIQEIINKNFPSTGKNYKARAVVQNITLKFPNKYKDRILKLREESHTQRNKDQSLGLLISSPPVIHVVQPGHNSSVLVM
jgi:hypothetical protein